MTETNSAIVHDPPGERENWLAAQIVDIAIVIHKALGPGTIGECL